MSGKTFRTYPVVLRLAMVAVVILAGAVVLFQNHLIDQQDADLQDLEERFQEALFRAEILELKLIRCEEQFNKLDQRSAICWEELAEVLP